MDENGAGRHAIFCQQSVLRHPSGNRAREMREGDCTTPALYVATLAPQARTLSCAARFGSSRVMPQSDSAMLNAGQMAPSLPKRRRAPVFTLISLLLFVGVVAAGVRSFFLRDFIQWSPVARRLP